MRDKRYWEAKRQTVHQREKELERQIEKYESDIAELDKKRKEILAKAKAQAEELLKESNPAVPDELRAQQNLYRLVLLLSAASRRPPSHAPELPPCRVAGGYGTAVHS